MSFGAVAASVAGAAVGGLMSGDKGQTSTATKEPWEEAAPWLKANLRTGQDLQGYYQQNPFNQQQQTGYQNLYGDLDNFRNQVAPGLMGFANQLMGTNYQRGPQQSGTPSIRQGGGLMPQPQQSHPVQQGLLGGPFSMGQGQGQSYGKIDFAGQNPFTNGAIDPTKPEVVDPNAMTPEEEDRLRMLQHILDIQGM